MCGHSLSLFPKITAVQPHVVDFAEQILITQVQTVTPVLQTDWIWANSSLGLWRCGTQLNAVYWEKGCISFGLS